MSASTKKKKRTVFIFISLHYCPRLLYILTLCSLRCFRSFSVFTININIVACFVKRSIWDILHILYIYNRLDLKRESQTWLTNIILITKALLGLYYMREYTDFSDTFPWAALISNQSNQRVRGLLNGY